MYYCYGEAQVHKGGIPTGGSDNSKLWIAFTAGKNPVQLIAGTYWSGDAAENYGLVMLPPGVNTSPNGTVTLEGSMGAIMLNFQMAGGSTAASPSAVWPGQKTAGQTPPVVPPFWTVYVVPLTAASAADFQLRLLGMELVKP